MARGSKRLRQFVNERGIEAEVVTLDSSTRTSQMAADSLGCEVAQIAKSIVFTGDSPIVVVISGDKRVDPRKLSEHLGWKAKIADAEAVRNGTGYVIGESPPSPTSRASSSSWTPPSRGSITSGPPQGRPTP